MSDTVDTNGDGGVGDDDGQLQLECRFFRDEQVREEFGDHSYATVEYASLLSPHATAAQSLLMDVDRSHALTDDQRDDGDKPAAPLLRAANLIMSEPDARAAARDVRAIELQTKQRSQGTCVHEIKIPPQGDKPHSAVTIRVFEYLVPVAYRLVGRVAPDNSADNERSYMVRVVWESHRYAAVSGRIVAVDDKLRARDVSLMGAVRMFDGKVAERTGDPLPIAKALADVVLESRSETCQRPLPADVRALLSANECSVDVAVVEAETRSVSDQMKDVLEHTLRQLDKVAHDDTGGYDDLPPLVHEDGANVHRGANAK